MSSTTQPGNFDPEDAVAVFSKALVETFGADACRVVETQIDSATGEALARWLAIWERLCGPEARRE